MLFRASALALGFLLVPLSAHAGGLFVPDVGARALSMGGAYVAGGDDLTALWYNPANLAAKGGGRFEVDLTLNFRSVSWQRAPDESVRPDAFPFVDNRNAPPIPVPGLFGSWDFGVKGLAVALGIYAPMNGTLRFTDTGPQRYTVIRSGSFVVFFHLGIAYEITPWLRVGAGLFLNSVFFDQRLAVNLGLGAPEDRTYDVIIDVYGTQHGLANFNVGVWVKPIPGANIEVGASFFPGRRARATGTARVTPPRDLAALLTVNGNQADFEIDFPWFVRAGIAWRIGDFATVEANYVYEGWSSLQSIKIYPKDVSLSIGTLQDFPVPELSLDRHWKDTHSVRAGGEVSVWKRIGLVARAGYFFESGAVPDAYVSIGSTDTNKHGVTVGAGATFGPISLHLGYAHVFFTDKNIAGSQMRLTNPLNRDNASIIGNGNYRFAHDMVTAGIGGNF
ncbi:MAG: outer membrane protein transport protein [Deltaproteobacteria bacterium]|nr:outer membrane protein transport protein [Deltaproteobacteria bacterium]